MSGSVICGLVLLVVTVAVVIGVNVWACTPTGRALMRDINDGEW